MHPKTLSVQLQIGRLLILHSRFSLVDQQQFRSNLKIKFHRLTEVLIFRIVLEM